jgi:hypothetical protein
VTRPRAADDCAAIQARMEELNLGARAVADHRERSLIGPRSHHRASTGETEHQDDRLPPRYNCAGASTGQGQTTDVACQSLATGS